MNYKKYFIGLIVITLIYSLYVQFSKDMGNIWIRKSSNNKNIFCPLNLINLIVAPFHILYFWKQRMLIINYPFLVGLYTLIMI